MRAMAYAVTILIGYFAMKSELPPPPLPYAMRFGNRARGKEKQRQTEPFGNVFPAEKTSYVFEKISYVFEKISYVFKIIQLKRCQGITKTH